MILPLIHFVALASLVTANPQRLDKRQANTSPGPSVSNATTADPSSAVGAPASVSVDNASAAPTGTSSAAPPPGASVATTSSVGDGGAPPASPSVQPSASDGSAGASPSSVQVSAGIPTSIAQVDGVQGGAAAAGGQVIPGAVYTTTRVIDGDPIPVTLTLVETKTIPTDAAGASATLLGGGQAVAGLNAAGAGKQIVASGSVVTEETFIPQPPLPSKSNSVNPAVFTAAAADWDISAPPQTREYTWDIEYTAGAPDGFHRRMATVNGQYPGPLLEANKGDTIVVHVNNQLNRSQSIHWHGLRQLKTPFMDGVPGTTQCPIRAGESFTYRFSVEDETGTYWWHSHSGNTQADGLHGGLIVHSPDQPYLKGRDYEEERIVYVTDWMRDQSDDIVNGIITNDGYRGGQTVPPPDSSLVNGIGQTVCADADPSVQCDQTTPGTLQVSQNRTRIRLISTASHAMYRVSIDNHRFQVIEVDDTPIEPYPANEIALHPGQRYSFIIDGSENAPGDQFFLRSRLATKCLGESAQEQEQKLIIQYPGDTLKEPVDQPWPDLMDASIPCRDFGVGPGFDEPLVPCNITPVPQTSFSTASFVTKAGTFVNWLGFEIIGFKVNDVQYLNYANKPALRDAALGNAINTSAAGVVEFNGPLDGAVDILINSRDPGDLAHPFHIHSRPFFVLARGDGNMTTEQLDPSTYDLIHPLRRDVITLTGEEWVLLRIPADTPGVWPMHCHIGWHLAAGKQGLINMQPEALRAGIAAGDYGPTGVGEVFPAEWNGLCAGTDPNDIEVGRRRRSVPPQGRWT